MPMNDDIEEEEKIKKGMKEKKEGGTNKKKGRPYKYVGNN